MKIGIVTFHKAINFGAILQAYALQTKLKELGHEPFFIDNNNTLSLLRWDMWISKSPIKTIKKIAASINNIIRIKNFSKFLNCNLILDKQEFNRTDYFYNHLPYADAYICGSDQIWNYKMVNKSDEQLFWLAFGNEKSRKIAYAASFGMESLPDDIAIRYSNYAKRLTTISVRESDAVKIINSFGISNVQHVVDPTLLLTAVDYSKIEIPCSSAIQPYCFCYRLGEDTKIEMEKIQIQFQNKYLYNIHNATCTYLLQTVNYGPGNWLVEIKNASFIITDSFHGVMFSLIYRKEFLVVLRKGNVKGMNSRIHSVLKQFKLSERAISEFEGDKIDTIFASKIPWCDVNLILNHERNKSITFLANSLS